MNKIIGVEEAVEHIRSGDTLLVGGFGLSGSPTYLIDALQQHDVDNLTVVSNNLGEEGRGLGKLLISKQIGKAVGSYFTTNRDAVKAWLNKDLEIELVPQGTLAEAIRAAGAGIPAFYTRTGVGTQLTEDKETRIFNGEEFAMIEAIHGDISLVKAMKADTIGNLSYSKTAMNFNPDVATAGRIVIAEVEEIVEVGEIEPHDIGTPHVYVDYIVENSNPRKGYEDHEFYKI